ncbi:protein of unknown function DUF1568 [Thioalkalivibrio sp. K90mix]|nr:transposase [Thioalkalivibrio sp. K90mix]ADC72302.1 protein of unknown function DUF1568 [Thioalkalivibrio sp. K90mix]
MVRPLRLEYPWALYHVTARGDRRGWIYQDSVDHQRFLDTLAQAVQRYNWVLSAYCLMGNHYHLLVETPDANLSRGMQWLNGVYTQRFNRRHRRVGHVLQGRYKAILVERVIGRGLGGQTLPFALWREPRQHGWHRTPL